MKRLFFQKILLGTILMVAISFVNAQPKKVDPADLIGRWELDFHKSIQLIKSSSKSHYDTLKQERKDRIKNSFSKRRITFKKDGGYLLEISEEKQVYGTWGLADDNVTLLVSINDGKVFRQKIETLNRTWLVLNLAGDQTKNSLFGTWYLKKSKIN